jgi:hypothetical protein
MKFISFMLVLIVVLTFATPAYAYLDPGTGSAILQGLLAGLAAIVVVGKLYWHRLKRMFGFGKGKTEEIDQGNSED